MITTYFAAAGTAVAATAVLLFSSVSFALRDFSRSRLSDRLSLRGRSDYLEPTLGHARDLIFVSSVARLLSNLMVLICVLRLLFETHYRLSAQYALAVLIAGAITLLTSVAIPLAAARYAGESIIAFFIAPLHLLRVVLSPVTKVSHWIDAVFKRASGGQATEASKIDEDILSVVEEGEKEGVVDEHEREMIESVISFRDTTAGQIMTARPEMVAIGLPTTLDAAKRTIEESGHSRIPVYEPTVDQVIGILYARDLLRYVGQPADRVDIKTLVRPALFVPETKPLRDLLRDFKLQKVHIAIVSDEYGGTAGLVTIEDVIEELIGDIADEHEKTEPAMLRQVDANTWEADARVYIDELNRTVGLSLPEDAGFDTLGGFVTTTLGRIPTAGTAFDDPAATFTVLDAEPQKVNRVRIGLTKAAG